MHCIKSIELVVTVAVLAGFSTNSSGQVYLQPLLDVWFLYQLSAKYVIV